MKRSVLSVLFVTAAVTCDAQGYPTKPVRIVNPFQAGGAGEIVFRQIAPVLEARFGQRIVLESRTGAGGNIGAQAVASAPADGYTLLLGATNNFVVNQFVFASMPFDPLTAFVPVTIIAEIPSVFYANPRTDAKSLREFVDWAKSNPGRANYASPGKGTTPHLNVELLAQASATSLTHVPYRGLPDAMNAVLSGDVHLYLAGLGAGRGHLQSGRLRALAVGSRERLAALPDVPTAIESGFRDFVAVNWFALAAPAGTDTVIVERWAREVRAALSDPETRKRFEENGFIPMGTSPQDTRIRVEAEARLWQQVVKRAGLQPE